MGVEWIPEQNIYFERKEGRKNDARLMIKNIYSTTNSIHSSEEPQKIQD